MNMATGGREVSRGDAGPDEEAAEMLPMRRCCFCIPRSSSNGSLAVGPDWWRRIRLTGNEEGWWARGINVLKKIREWSEIIAGPRWKTFIRRFNRNKSGGSRHGKFQYDPLSYALNFDDGVSPGPNSELDEEYEFRNFSSRFAAIPMSAKSSMDIGKDTPIFA
ncbi:hypothetical protein U1Q18_007322 [Sarracenia purpurea var. burkii]